MKTFANILSVVGGLLLLAGACLMITGWKGAPWTYTVGAVLFGAMQIMDRYRGSNAVLRRLRVQQVVASLLFIVAGVLMFCTHHNEWIVCLTIAVVFELYTAFRIPQEERRE